MALKNVLLPCVSKFNLKKAFCVIWIPYSVLALLQLYCLFPDQLNTVEQMKVVTQPSAPDVLHRVTSQFQQTRRTEQRAGMLRPCTINFSCKPEDVQEAAFPVSFQPPTMMDLVRVHSSSFSMGGQYSPQDCHQPDNLAVILPFRDRDVHFRIFLNNLISFFQLQRRKFRIFIVEQLGPQLFNRAALMNIGFEESQKLGKFDCFAMQDVDAIPVNLCNVYRCEAKPRHLVVAADRYNYTRPYYGHAGGGNLFSKKAMEKINGFTNVMFGWGREDDNLNGRIEKAGFKWSRYSLEIARYVLIPHTRDHTNPVADRLPSESVKLAKFAKYDGLSTLNYTVVGVQDEPLFTKIQVFIPGPTTLEEANQFYETKAQTLNDLYMQAEGSKDKEVRMSRIRNKIRKPNSENAKRYGEWRSYQRRRNERSSSKPSDLYVNRDFFY